MKKKHLAIYSTLSAPEKPPGIPSIAKWLSGEGAGSWFVVNWNDSGFKVERFSAEGKIECSGFFYEVRKTKLDFLKPYAITYISHCDQVTIIQNESKIILKRRA
jgi:hypothetical protein